VWLEAEKEGLFTIGFERVTSPWKPADDAVLTALIAASERRKPISVLYLSLRRRTPVRRTICPHTIVDADGRLHVRAFDYARRRFADFLVTRINEVDGDESAAWIDKAADVEWHEFVDVAVAPKPEMSLEQAQAAMKDVGLPPEGGTIRTRRALAFYLVRTLRLSNLEVPDTGKRYVCKNLREVAEWVGVDAQGDSAEV